MIMYNLLLRVLLFVTVLIYNSIPALAQNGNVKDTLPQFHTTEAKLYNAYLIQVSDVNVETEVGNLPRLPVYVQGTYTNQLKGKGPKVRVVWPAPTDNNA